MCLVSIPIDDIFDVAAVQIIFMYKKFNNRYLFRNLVSISAVTEKFFRDLLEIDLYLFFVHYTKYLF
jgi:hypothetical protein